MVKKSYTKTIFSFLPELTEKELQQIKARVEFLLQSKKPAATSIKGESADDIFRDQVYAVVASQLGHHLNKKYPDKLSVFRKSAPKLSTEVVNGIDHLVSLVNEWFPHETRNTKMSAAQWLAGIVFSAIEIPKNWSTIAYHLKQAETIFDKQFPGYLESGYHQSIILPRVIKNARKKPFKKT